MALSYMDGGERLSMTIHLASHPLLPVGLRSNRVISREGVRCPRRRDHKKGHRRVDAETRT